MDFERAIQSLVEIGRSSGLPELRLARAAGACATQKTSIDNQLGAVSARLAS